MSGGCVAQMPGPPDTRKIFGIKQSGEDEPTPCQITRQARDAHNACDEMVIHDMDAILGTSVQSESLLSEIALVSRLGSCASNRR